MKILTSISRREFIRLIGVGAGALVLSSCNNTPTPTKDALTTTQALTSGEDVVLNLIASPTTIQLRPGDATRIWQYQGQILQGSSSSLQVIPESFLGPIIRLTRGQNLKLHFKNQIPDDSIIHWHGMHVPDQSDGHPRFAISEGQTYDYEYPILNRAGTYWYHPHPHGRTGPQVYYGMAGLLIISDDEEAKLGLPSGEFDLPLVIQDRTFDNQNQLVYVPDTMNGFFGNQVMVNGQSQHTWQVQPRPYRLRLLNGSNARIYKLAWEDDTLLNVIATDGGLLVKSVQRKYLTLAPGERVELWVEF